jgi:hypothetical protein
MSERKCDNHPSLVERIFFWLSHSSEMMEIRSIGNLTSKDKDIDYGNNITNS